MRVERQAETGEELLWAQGENQIAVATERLKRKFGTAVITRPPRVPYRETIRGHARVEGRHKKQTGGRGQFGHVWLELEPNPGGGVVFAEHIVGGVVPRQFFPGVEKGVRDVAEKGPIAGYPVIDFKATLVDGSFHTVDSDEVSFRVAGSMATRQGIHEAQPVLLEPIMEVEVRVPEVYMGDVNRDLATRRGRVLGMDSDGAQQTVQGAGAPGRAVHLRHRAPVTDGRPGHVPPGPRRLRGSARATRRTGSSRRTRRTRSPRATEPGGGWAPPPGFSRVGSPGRVTRRAPARAASAVLSAVSAWEVEHAQHQLHRVVGCLVEPKDGPPVDAELDQSGRQSTAKVWNSVTSMVSGTTENASSRSGSRNAWMPMPTSAVPSRIPLPKTSATQISPEWPASSSMPDSQSANIERSVSVPRIRISMWP